MRKFFWLMFFISACSGDEVYRDIQGIVKSDKPTVLNIPASPPPNITILGRNSDEFKVEYATASLGTPVANFTMRNVPSKQPVIFELTGSGLEPIVTFPFDLKATPVITIPALESGTKNTIIGEIEAASGTTVSKTSTGIILGQLNSIGTAGGSCASIREVVVKDRQTHAPATVLGPFYFRSDGLLADSGHFSDTQCNYVVANVAPGNYTLEFLDESLVKQKEHEVVVLPGKLIFGMDVP